MRFIYSSWLFLLTVILLIAGGCTHNKIKTIEGFTAAKWSEIGCQDLNAKRWSEAVNAFNKTIDLNPDDASAYNHRGLAYSHFDHKKSIVDFDKALELNPKYREAFNNRGNLYFRLGDYKQAILNYDRVIELNPKDAEAYYNRGNAYDRLHDSRFANQDMKMAAKLGNIFAQKYLKEKGMTW